MSQIEYIPCSDEFIAVYGLTPEIRNAAARRLQINGATRATPRHPQGQEEAQNGLESKVA